ncbi:MAG: T9SS type A sorting domain-containing protein, partial [bacterium]
REVGYYDSPGWAKGVAVSGSYAYLADGFSGVRVVDISDPREPREVGYYDSPGFAWDVAVSGDLIYLADASNLGIYRFTLLSAPEEEKGIPTQFGITSLYPNPFNSTTTIGYSLPYRSYVRLSVYDLGGRRVKTLLSGEVLPGRHSFIWDAGSNPAGVYFVELEAGGQRAILKALLSP